MEHDRNLKFAGTIQNDASGKKFATVFGLNDFYHLCNTNYMACMYMKETKYLKLILIYTI